MLLFARSGNSEGFRSFVPGTGDEDQIYIYYMMVSHVFTTASV